MVAGSSVCFLNLYDDGQQSLVTRACLPIDNLYPGSREFDLAWNSRGINILIYIRSTLLLYKTHYIKYYCPSERYRGYVIPAPWIWAGGREVISNLFMSDWLLHLEYYIPGDVRPRKTEDMITNQMNLRVGASVECRSDNPGLDNLIVFGLSDFPSKDGSCLGSNDSPVPPESINCVLQF